MTALTLRPYQADAIEQIKSHFSQGKNVLLHLATGGGKTVIFSTVMKGVYLKGRRAVLAVRGRELVDNASQRLLRESVPHGVLMANHWNKRPWEKIQVASIDTIYARREKADLPPADLIVIDEAHMASSPSFRWFISQYPDAFKLAVTATPHVKDGLRHLADEVVYPITIRDLIAQGFLSPPRYFAPSRPNVDGVKVDRKTGDYNLADLGAAVNKDVALFGDIVTHYKKHADGRPAVAFAVNVTHSRQIVASFKAAGIPAAHVEADTPDEDRKAILSDLSGGHLKVVSNVGILCTGVDMPYLGAVILARPTMSYNLHIQQIGRGTRVFPGKADFIVLDHAGNLDRHGLIEFERECNLDGKPQGGEKLTTVTCEKCYNVFELIVHNGVRDYVCRGLVPPDMVPCLHDNRPTREAPPERNTSVDESSVLREIESTDEFLMRAAVQFYEERVNEALKYRRKPGWVFYKVRDRFGEHVAREVCRGVQRRFAAR